MNPATNFGCTPFIPGLVSVIVPVHNRAHIVGKTLDSILTQTYHQLEVVTVNDGSTDDSLFVLQAYAADYPDRIVVVDQAKAGQVRARNHGLAKARGEYLAFLDSDDTWEKEKLALQMQLFKGDVGLVYCGIYEVNDAGKITRTVLCESEVIGNAYGQLLIRNRMTGGSVVVTRKALDSVGIFDDSLKAGENWDLWIRIAKEYQIAYVNQPLVRYLRHQGNMSLNSKLMSDAALAILQKHMPNRPAHGELRDIYDAAYANYFYNQGVGNFSIGDYVTARKFFYQSWRYRLLYRDSALRVIRSFFGVKLNGIIASLKLQNKKYFHV